MSDASGDADDLREASGAPYCMAPWVHLHVTGGGNVTPCCRIAKPLANINRDGLPDIWNGAAMRRLRLRFRSGDMDPLCWRCRSHEETGIESYRQLLTRRFGHHRDWVDETGADGSVTTARPIYWDIRFSNICNFRCRTCWHGASSRWYGDAVKLGTQVADTPVIQNVQNSAQFLDALQTFAPDVEEIVFAGGEPLITDEHYRILEGLIARGIDGVKLRYVTNLSELRYRRTDVVALWNKFPDVEVNASLDGIGARGELVRKDLSWPRFQQNVHRIRAEAPHVLFGVDMTVSVLNLFQLPQIQQTLLEEGLVEDGRLDLRPLHDPAHYNIKMLPRAMKVRAAGMLHRQADWIADRGARLGLPDTMVSGEREKLETLVTFMNAEDLSEHLLAFSRVTRSLDRLRDEQVADICPELRPLVERPLLASGRGSMRLLRSKLVGAVNRAARGTARS